MNSCPSPAVFVPPPGALACPCQPMCGREWGQNPDRQLELDTPCRPARNHEVQGLQCPSTGVAKRPAPERPTAWALGEFTSPSKTSPLLCGLKG
jgi:hypothetical protein